MAGNCVVGAFLLALALLSPGPQAAPLDARAETAAFEARVEQYVVMHRRLEGPLPPLMVTNDMKEVRRLMDDLRKRIRAERGGQAQGAVVTKNMAEVLHQVVAATLTRADIVDLVAEIDEHTPAGMRAVRVNEALPPEAPFVMIAPQLLRALPPLPHELRYLAVSKSLVIWDHHADLVVEVVPGLFDPLTYSTSEPPVRRPSGIASRGE